MASSPTALVLGAGIMGLSAAWGLARQGYAVRIVEQDEVPNPRGASVDHHRLIRHAYGAQAGYMRMIDPAYAAWDMLWRDLGEVLHIRTGVLAVSGSAAGWLGESRAALAADGRAFEELSPADVPARFPMLTEAGIGAAFLMAPGGVLLAERIVAGLARHLAARGVPILRGRASDVMPDGALCVSPTAASNRQTCWSSPPAPGRRACCLPRLRRASSRPARSWCGWRRPRAMPKPGRARPMLLDLAEEGGFYAVPPVAGTPLKIGDHRFSRQGDAEADPRDATPAEAEEILAFARPRIRNLGDYRILGARACYYDVEDGERFLVEPLGSRAFLMSGFTGHGFKFAPLLGLALAAAARDASLRANLVPWAAGEAPPAPGLLAAIEGIPA